MQAGGGAHSSSAVQRALAHPLRAEILTVLRQGPSSPSALAQRFDQSVGVVSYHVRVLTEVGLAELIATVPKRGALQHVYVACETDALGITLMLSAEDAHALHSDLRERVEAARRTAAERPGEVALVIVGHILPPDAT